MEVSRGLKRKREGGRDIMRKEDDIQRKRPNLSLAFAREGTASVAVVNGITGHHFKDLRILLRGRLEGLGYDAGEGKACEHHTRAPPLRMISKRETFCRVDML